MSWGNNGWAGGNTLYDLLSCAGYFRSRQGQLWQLVLTRRERGGAYRSVRPPR